MKRLRFPIALLTCVFFSGCTAPSTTSMPISPESAWRDAIESRNVLWYYDRYDRFNGTREFELTVIELDRLLNRSVLNMYVSYAYADGGRPSDATSVTFVFTSDVPALMRFHDLTLLVDGRRQQIPTLATGGPFGSTWMSQVVASMSVDSFRQLAQAKSAEGRLGPLEFRWSDEQLAYMEEFARRAATHPGSQAKEQYRRQIAKAARTSEIHNAYLGVYLIEGLAQHIIGVDGLLIVSVAVDSPAERAGLRPTIQTENEIIAGDVILTLQNRPAHRLQELSSILDRCRPGDRLPMRIYRNGEELEVAVTLDPPPQRR